MMLIQAALFPIGPERQPGLRAELYVMAQCFSDDLDNAHRRLDDWTVEDATILRAAFTMSARRSRSAVACERCRGRKVRCSVMLTGTPCVSCTQDGNICTVRQVRAKKWVDYEADANLCDNANAPLQHTCAIRKAVCLYRGPHQAAYLYRRLGQAFSAHERPNRAVS